MPALESSKSESDLSSIGGWVAALYDPITFATDQIPTSTFSALPAATVHSEVLTLQLGNLYLLMCLMCLGVIVHQKEAWAIRNYLIVLAIGDIGHLYGSIYGLGSLENLLDFASYNQMTWGNVAATLFLLVARSLTLLGAFGPLRDVKAKSS